MDLIDRINANYNNLSRVHKRIVDYITDNPDRACFQSLKDFSDSVSASPVTVLRCLDKLGINGFLDLKKELRAYTRQSVYPGKRLASALSGLNSTSDIVHRVVQADLDNITNTFENLSSRDMYRACDILRNCGRVHLVAQNAAAVFAEPAQFAEYRRADIRCGQHHFPYQHAFRHPHERCFLHAVLPPP